MGEDAVIATSDGANRGGETSGHGFCMWDNHGHTLLSAGGGSGPGTATVNQQEAAGLTERMLRRSHEPEYDDCQDFVEKILPQTVQIADEIRAANDQARARNQATVDAKYQRWLDAGGTRAGIFEIGQKVWLSVPVTHDATGQLPPGKLRGRWRGPLIVLSRKDLTYRIGVPTGGVLPSPVHANRLRAYHREGPAGIPPPEDVDRSGVDWDRALEPLVQRSEEVRNRSGNRRPTEVLQCRRHQGRDHLGHAKHSWRVRCDDGVIRWAQRDDADDHLIVASNNKAQATRGTNDEGATVDLVERYLASAM